jgi:nucleotide-binding universal stress UspA family protein
MGTIPEGVSEARTVLVVGVDLTPLAPHLLHVARDLVRVATSGEIHVVTVLRPQSIPADVIGAIPAPGPSNDAAIQRAQGELEALCNAILGDTGGSTGIDVVMHVRLGRAAEEIERVAEEVRADVIVVEAHDRTGFARLFHRSVSAELSRNAPCSVLTVRPRREPERAVLSAPPATSGAPYPAASAARP